MFNTSQPQRRFLLLSGGALLLVCLVSLLNWNLQRTADLSNLSIIALGYACMRIRYASEKKLEMGIQNSERLEALGQHHPAA